MSITTVDRSKTISSPVVYAVYGTRANAKAGVVRAAALTVVCGGEMENPSDGRWAGIEFIEAGREVMNKNSRRSNRTITLVQSWAKDELNKDDPADVEKANAMGVDLAQRLAPDTPYVVATHTDSKSGCVHNHIILLNHDLSTGKAAPERADNWHAVKAINDEVMRDWGMRTLEPEGFVKLRRAERMAIKEGKSIDSTGLTVRELTGENWADYLRKRVDELVNDERVLKASDGLEKAREVAGDYNLSLRSTNGELSIGLVDDGEEVSYTTRTPKGNSRKRKAVDTGSKFGPGYTASGLSERIAEAHAQLAAAIARQQRIDRINKLKSEREKEDDSGIDRTAGERSRGVPGRSSGPGTRSVGDDAEQSRDGCDQDRSGPESSGRAGEADPVHRHVGAGTADVIRAAAEARQAAEVTRSDNGGHKGVRRSAESRRRDDKQPGKHVDGHGASDAKYPENTQRPSRDVQGDSGSREASREVKRRKRQERLARINQTAIDELEFDG